MQAKFSATFDGLSGSRCLADLLQNVRSIEHLDADNLSVLVDFQVEPRRNFQEAFLGPLFEAEIQSIAFGVVMRIQILGIICHRFEFKR